MNTYTHCQLSEGNSRMVYFIADIANVGLSPAFHSDFFFSSRRRHTTSLCDWSSDVCSSDLMRRSSMANDSYPVAIDDLRIAKGAGKIAEAWLADPTQRYRHFVLGSQIGSASCRARV